MIFSVVSSVVSQTGGSDVFSSYNMSGFMQTEAPSYATYCKFLLSISVNVSSFQVWFYNIVIEKLLAA